MSGLDSWMKLTRVDPNEEVQGEIRLSLEMLKEGEKISLRCQVAEASGAQKVKKIHYIVSILLLHTTIHLREFTPQIGSSIPVIIKLHKYL